MNGQSQNSIKEEKNNTKLFIIYHLEKQINVLLKMISNSKWCELDMVIIKNKIIALKTNQDKTI